MDLGLIYELANKENIFLLIAGFVFGFSLGYAWGKSKAARIELKQRGCGIVDEIRNEYVSVEYGYKNGKLKHVNCSFKSKKPFKKPYCRILCSECLEGR